MRATPPHLQRVLMQQRPDALWAAWLTLDDTQRHAMDAAFQDIAALISRSW